MKRNLLAFLFIASLVSSASAQETPRLGETLDVSIVNVDVVVTDKQGNRIRGLRQEDFELREGGKVQPISNFAEYVSDADRGTIGVEGTQQTQRAAPRRDRRTILVFFESMQLVHAAADEFAKSLHDTISRMVGPGDAVSFVIWRPHHETEHIEFTNDPAQIAAAIEKIRAAGKIAAPDVLAEQRRDTAQRRDLMSAQPSVRGAGQGAPALELPTDPVSDVGPYILAAYNEMTVRVAAINSAITSMAGIEGKKILLLATRRLGEVAGAEFVFNAGADRVSQFLKSRYGTDELMKTLVDNANSSGVTIYPVNPPGLTTSSESVNATQADYLTLMNETHSMQKIANQTGGLMATGWKDVVELLPRVASDATDYYSLAYRVTVTGADRSRDIVVKTRNPEYKVRARTQFVEKSDDTRMRDRLRATMFRAEQPGSTIGIRAAARPSTKGRKESTMQVRVRIPIADLTMLPQANGKHAGKFSVYVAAASDLDALSDVTQKSQPFEVAPAEMQQALAGHFTYDLDLKVTNKSKYIAVGVFDEVGRTYGFKRLELQQAAK
ncbi:MAG TPA: VWA domain-containing protein [Thermoanaerobaculia bacterium]|jgi:VWFA-related protein